MGGRRRSWDDGERGRGSEGPVMGEYKESWSLCGGDGEGGGRWVRQTRCLGGLADFCRGAVRAPGALVWALSPATPHVAPTCTAYPGPSAFPPAPPTHRSGAVAATAAAATLAAVPVLGAAVPSADALLLLLRHHHWQLLTGHPCRISPGSERWPDHPAPRPPPASARAPLMPAFRLLHPCTRSSTDPPVRHIHTPRRRGALSEARLSPMGSVVWQN